MKEAVFPDFWATLNPMLPISPLALPFSSLESGRLGVERAAESQEVAAQETVEALLVESPTPSTPRASLEASLMDVDVARYLALANARVVQTAEFIAEESTNLGESSG